MIEVEPGKRGVIEGNDGTGKSTISDMLAWQVQKNGFLTLRIDEPDSPVDQYGNVILPHVAKLRHEIKDGTQTHNPEADLGMFNVSRFLSYTRVTKPYTAQGWWALQSRDSTSSEAYQGGGDQLGINYVHGVVRKFMNDATYSNPDFKTILIFKNEIERLKRIQGRGPLEKPDTFESKGSEFQTRVNHSYHIIAERDGTDITLIEAHQPREEIADIVLEKMIGAVGVQLAKHGWEEYWDSKRSNVTL